MSMRFKERGVASMRRIVALFLTLAMVVTVLPIGAVGAAVGGEERGFPLFQDGAAADILVSAEDYPQIVRVAGDLRDDVNRVTGETPKVVNNEKDLGKYAVIVGSVDKSQTIRRLMEEGKLDEAKGIAGKWESYVIKTVETPAPGVEKALVIAGSDKRGAIYGVYDLSQQIGVSPYYWWADVTPKVQKQILLPDTVKLEGEPSVKYRGIFINDEKNFTNWSKQFQDSQTPGQPNAGAYERVFELLLRLKANTLWPAMHNYSDAFNRYEDENGISVNAKLADSYGVIMGASHCEMLLRNNEGEWSRWANQNKDKYDAKGTPSYDWTKNPQALEAYWRERVRKNKDFEGIYNIGMRGIHDTGMAFGGLTNPTLADKIAALQEVIDCQRRILSEELGKPADQIPQAFIPYKEAATFYNGDENTPGVKIPDDVILMWADDNHGFVRQYPTEAEKQRSGGSGIYYHVSYWGVNYTSYLWLNTTPLSQMYEELRKAYDTGSQKYWILNVGDIKPSEISLEFFMNMGWDIDQYNDTNIDSFLTKAARRDFLTDEATSAEIADIMTKYYQYNIAKRPEFQGYEASNPDGTYSIVSYGDEGQIRVDQLNGLVQRAEAIYSSMDAERKDAFYQMVYYPLRASTDNLEMNIYWQKNQLYAQQGRYGSVGKYEELSMQAYYDIIKDLTYYNKTMQDGKWDGIINPYVKNIPTVLGPREFAKVSENAAGSGIGAVCEGQKLPEDPIVMRYSSMSDCRRFIDIYSREEAANSWDIEVSDDFIVPSKRSGTVEVEDRVWVGIDWSKAQAGENTGTITVKDQKGFAKSFQVSAYKADEGLTGRTYMEDNGVVSIEAEHYTESMAKNGSEWRLVENWGRSGDAMKVYPDVADRIDENFAENSAQLKYDIYFTSAGVFTGHFYRIPTLNEGNTGDGERKTCRTAVGLEGTEPSLLRGISTAVDVSEPWIRGTLEQVEKLPFTIKVEEPGLHTLTVYQSDAGMAFDKIIINTGGEQSAKLGPPESFNTISYTSPLESSLPELQKEQEADAVKLYRMEEKLDIPVNDFISIGTREPVRLTAKIASMPVRMIWSVESGGDFISLRDGNDGTASVSGRAEGSAILKAVPVEDPQDVQYCTVRVSTRQNRQPGAFIEENGEVLIDLTAAMEQSEYASCSDGPSHYWRLNEDGNAMTVQPDFGLQWAASTTAETADSGTDYLNKYAPQLNFQIEFKTAGTYYIHTLSSHPTDDSDSYHVGLDGQWQCHTNYATHQGAMRWEKSESRWKLQVFEPGVHTLNIWAREDGIVSHRIYLTTQAGKSCFEGWGPEASKRNQVDVGDKSALERLAASHADKTPDGYTAESWTAFANAFSAAKELLGNTYAAQSEIEEAQKALESAAEALMEAEKIILGDLDLDQAVTITDVMEACKILARKAGGIDPTADEIKRGDLDQDQAVTITDVMGICKILARKVR